MKFYCEQITIMLDGTSAHSLTEFPGKNEALSAYHSALASAIINPAVDTIYAEAKDNFGTLYGKSVLRAQEELVLK